MEQTQAASSTADPFNGQETTRAEFQKYRDTGEVPERFKPAPAANDAPEETADAEPEEAEDAPESAPEEPQEQPQKKSPAEKRILQLLAKQKELERKLEEVAKPTQSASSAAQTPRQPQTFNEWLDQFDVDTWEEDYVKANPTHSFAKMQLAEKVFVDGAKAHFDSIQQRVNAEKQALDEKVADASSRYENFDEIKESFLNKIVQVKDGQPIALIPPTVIGVINSSDMLPDLLYTIGSNESELNKFIAMAKADPNKAIRYVAKVESLIAEELAKPKETPARGEDGKFKANAPEKRQTSAPKPIAPVNGGASRAFDVSDDSLSPEEWMRKRNKQLGIG